jgi:hypothetical protein
MQKKINLPLLIFGTPVLQDSQFFKNNEYFLLVRGRVFIDRF